MSTKSESRQSMPPGRDKRTSSRPPKTTKGPAKRNLRWAPSGYLLLLPLTLMVLAVLVLPVAHIVVLSFTDPTGALSVDVYQDVATSSVYQASIVNTLVLASVVTIICLAMGYLIAYRMAVRWQRFASIIGGVLLLSFWSGLLIRTFAWMILLGKNGVLPAAASVVGINELPQLLYNPTGAVIGMVSIMLPYMALTIYASMNRVDYRTIDAAESLGARPSVAFWRVYVPATLPGIAAGCLLVFVITLGFYITPELLGGPETVMISQRIAKVVQQLLDFRLAGALSLTLVVVTIALLAIYNRLFSLRDLGRGM